MDFVEIGKLKKPHGLQGELKGTIDKRFWEDIGNAPAVFIDQKGDKAPYFIEYARGGVPLILKLEEIDTKEDAALLTNKLVYLRREDVQLDDEAIQSRGLMYGYLEGYTLYVEEMETVGPIVQVDEYPQQEMATVRYQERDVLVPLREAWITQLDKVNKTLQMDLPEGLLDL